LQVRRASGERPWQRLRARALRPPAPRRPALRPPALQPGDRVAVVAPGAPVDPERLRAGIDLLASWGLDPVVSPHVLDRAGFLAGRDADRLADLAAAWSDPTIRGIVCARGGYGAQRIVDRLDYAGVRGDPKVFVGYSDVTALHLALGGRAGLVTFHGPMAAWDASRTDAR
jgi:muramoyltetrapeptide carboxypeptidase